MTSVPHTAPYDNRRLVTAALHNKGDNMKAVNIISNLFLFAGCFGIFIFIAILVLLLK